MQNASNLITVDDIKQLKRKKKPNKKKPSYEGPVIKEPSSEDDLPYIDHSIKEFYFNKTNNTCFFN